MTTPFDFDAVVLGAGAAGLMAATHAAERGRRTLLLEKNRKPGVKILMSGGTRCNITHDCHDRGIVEAFGHAGKFLHSPLAALGVADAIAYFNAEGVATKSEETGKIFPVSDRALDVLNALLARLHRSGARLALEEPAADLRPLDGGGFSVTTPKRTVTAERVILTTGGRSYPGCGTRGDGYAFAQRFGHTIVEPKPALVPVTVADPWVGELRGVTLDDVSVSVWEGGKALSQRRAGFLFAHFGLTGPAPLDVSKAISRHADPTSLKVQFDFMPASREAEVDEYLQRSSLDTGKRQLAGVLAERLPRRLCDALLTLVGQPIDRRAAGLAKGDRAALVGVLKRCRLGVRGTLGFEKAEVTAGGVSLDEVDSRTMQSKRQAGLYFAGEVLDLDGPIGGYNFQAAWSTGWLAGRSV